MCEDEYDQVGHAYDTLVGPRGKASVCQGLDTAVRLQQAWSGRPEPGGRCLTRVFTSDLDNCCKTFLLRALEDGMACFFYMAKLVLLAGGAARRRRRARARLCGQRRNGRPRREAPVPRRRTPARYERQRARV